MNRWNETAEKLGPGLYKLCFDYRWVPPNTGPIEHWCYLSDDPEPPPPPAVTHSYTWCPTSLYPDTVTGTWTAGGGGSCPCLTGSPRTMTWDIIIGPQGGWRTTWTGCSGGTITVTVWSDGAAGGGSLSWKGKATNGTWTLDLAAITLCGVLPVMGGFLPFTSMCPFTLMTLTVT